MARVMRRTIPVEAPEAISGLLAEAKLRGYAVTRVGYHDGEGVVNILSPTGTLIYAWRVDDPEQARVWFRPISHERCCWVCDAQARHQALVR